MAILFTHLHIWLCDVESVKTSDINVQPNRQLYGTFALPTKTVLTALSVTATKWDTSCLIADWTTTGKQRQLLMIFTITTQRRSKGMITHSVDRAVWTKKVHSAKTKIWTLFHIPRRYVIQRRMNKQSGFNAEQIEKDNYPKIKTVWRINLK